MTPIDRLLDQLDWLAGAAAAAAPTIRSGGDGHSAPRLALALEWGRKRRQNGKQFGSVPDRPARVVGTSTLSDGNILTLRRKGVGDPRNGGDESRCSRPDAPASVVVTNANRKGGAILLANKVSRVGVGEAHVLAWPDLPNGCDAVILSERAAGTLQGFAETWVFAGKTKKARWAQIGMAMPPPLAEAVARAVLRQLARTAEVAA